MRDWIWVGIALLERVLFLCILESYFLIPLNVTCRALVFLAGKHFSQTFLLLISERSIRASSLQRNCVYPILLLALLLLTVVTLIYIYIFTTNTILYHVTKFPIYLSFTVYYFYTQISSFTQFCIHEKCFYLLIFYFEKFST